MPCLLRLLLTLTDFKLSVSDDHDSFEEYWSEVYRCPSVGICQAFLMIALEWQVLGEEDHSCELPFSLY